VTWKEVVFPCCFLLFGIWKYRNQPTIDTWYRITKVFVSTHSRREAAVQGNQGFIRIPSGSRCLTTAIVITESSE
jgi:hypothetical protein